MGMNRSPTPPGETLSPGNYTNVKYWRVKPSREEFIIAVGCIPWKAILFIETFVCGLSAVIIYFTFSGARHNLAILIPMYSIFVLVALGCFFLPVMQVRGERIKGDILVYDPNKEILNLPREQLAIRKSQVVEFRILQERSKRDKKGGDFASSIAPAELKLIYKNPNLKSVTLLRTAGISFEDVIAAIKESNLSKIMLHQQASEANTWEIREV